MQSVVARLECISSRLIFTDEIFAKMRNKKFENEVILKVSITLSEGKKE
jgi:hypothetical protein